MLRRKAPKRKNGASASTPAPQGTSAAEATPIDIRLPAQWSDPEWRRTVREEFKAAKPFGHFAIRPLLGPAGCKEVRADLEKVAAREKETDLFRFFQTDDIAPRDKAGAKKKRKANPLPALDALRRIFGTEEFRSFFREVTDCGELSDRLDLSSQIYPHGGHLLCHDDVIGTRKISFIYYLTDDEKDWSPEEGGALELYPQEDGAAPGTPACVPTKEILPHPDSLAFFVVQPGVSFHAVREVRGQRARPSMQGWLHAPSLEMTVDFEHRKLATLQQILAQPLSSVPAPPEKETRRDELPALTAEDKDVLRQWMSPEYLDSAQLEVVADRFADDSYAVLTGFLRPEIASRVLGDLHEVDAADGFSAKKEEPVPLYRAGASDGWVLVGPPHLRRYLRFQSGGSSGSDALALAEEAAGPEKTPHRRLGADLAKLSRGLFGSEAFQRWLQACTRLTPKSSSGIEVRRFRPGLDYTVAARAVTSKEEDAELDATLTFAADDAEGPVADVWAAEEVGGFESYLAADEEEETAEAQEVYRGAESEGPLVNLRPIPNALCLVMRDAKTLRFIKYLSRDAPSSRVDVACSFSVDPPEGSDAEEGQNVTLGEATSIK